MKETLIAPSLLSADFSKMGEEVNKIVNSKGDWIHIDVMDGTFVPDLTFGHKMVSDLRGVSALPMDVHLMVTHPETFIEKFAEAGADNITVHAEAAVHLNSLLTKIRQKGKKTGISIVPSTPVWQITEVLHIVDLVLIMTVNAGYGGQDIIPSCLEKVAALKKLRQEGGYTFLLEVDGGINTDTARDAREAGADVLVVGSAFFNSPQPGEFVKELKGTD